MSQSYDQAAQRLIAEQREARARDAAMSLPLWEAAAPHNRTPTSIAAAESLAGHLQRLELLVLRGIIGLGNATSEELEEALRLSGNTVRPRIVTLREKGYITDLTGTRATRSGRQAVVHVSTPAGFDAAARANEGYADAA